MTMTAQQMVAMCLLALTAAHSAATLDGSNKEPAKTTPKAVAPQTPKLTPTVTPTTVPPKPTAPPPLPMTPAPLSPACADPSVEIGVQLLNKTSATAGRIRVTATVKNIGQSAWVPTSYTHRLRATLAIKSNEQYYNGQALLPPRSIDALGAGQQVVLTHELNWTATYNAQYPKFVAYVSESGQPDYSKTPKDKLDCRADNNRKEQGAADVNKLFGDIPPPPPPLAILGYKTEFGAVVTSLRYHRGSDGSGRLRGSAAAPHAQGMAEVMVPGATGTINLRVAVACATRGVKTGEKDAVSVESVKLNYDLSEYFSLGQMGFNWLPLGNVSHSVPLAQICSGEKKPFSAQPIAPTSVPQKGFTTQ